MPEKYQEEIEEILKGIEKTSPNEPPPGKMERTSRELDRSIQTDDQPPPDQPNPRWRWPVISPGKIMLAGLGLLLVGFLLKFNPMVWVGLVLLVGAYLLFFIRPRSINGTKIWRGRSMEDNSSPWDRVKRWLKS